MRRIVCVIFCISAIVVLNLLFMPVVHKKYKITKKEAFRILLNPRAEKWSAFEFRTMKAFFYTLNLRIYLGGLIEEDPNLPSSAELPVINTAEVVSEINPYYYDIYYLANGFLTWDFRNIKEANRLLEKAIKYRKDDWFLYFLLGFNYFYFLHDFERGGYYIEKAAEIKKSPFLATLASRLMYASGRTEVAIALLKSMVETTQDEGWKRSLKKRLKALEGVWVIEKAVERFKMDKGKNPCNIEELLKEGYLRYIPTDPYGGVYYIDKDGNVKSTSNFIEKKGK